MAQQIRKDLVKVVSKVRQSNDPKVLNTLKTQLDRLKAIGGLKVCRTIGGYYFCIQRKVI